MLKNLKALGLAVALTAGGAGVAAAQDTAATMDAGLSMVELSVGKELNRLGITDIDVMSLTLEQVAQLRAILGDRSLNATDRSEAVRDAIRKG